MGIRMSAGPIGSRIMLEMGFCELDALDLGIDEIH
jgi:hypothetical protein